MAPHRGHHAAAGVRLLFAFLAILHFSSALKYVSSSPCESLCSDQNAGTLQNDTVCLDANYRSTTAGKNFQTCVACLLNSTAVDTSNNQTDVQWGLFNLRYALSSCMFGIPEKRVSISSPCQVSCQPLNNSIGYQLTSDNENASPSFDFCTAAQFDDSTISKCAFCYSFIPQQLYLANFLQALHIICRDAPTPGEPFFPDARSLFNETLIAGPATASDSSGGGGGLHGTALAVAIALPIVGGIIIIAGSCWGCWIFTRKRRRRMAASGRMSRVRSAHADGTTYSPVTPKSMWGENEPPREMSKLSPVANHGLGNGPSFAQRASGYSSQYPNGMALGGHDEQGTSLRNSFQRDDVGPGQNQIQDPDLHEQYFGVADGREDEAGPSKHYAHGAQFVDERDLPAHLQGHGLGLNRREDGERGQWVQ